MKENYVLTALKGLIIGGTMLVPGASGGSMAMILGIYDRLISAVSSLTERKRDNLLFLLVFCLGGGAGILIFARPLLAVMESYPMPAMYFFLGAVAGGVPLILRQAEVKRVSWDTLAFLFAGILCVLLIGLIPVGVFQKDASGAAAAFSGAGDVLFLFLAGVIAAVALVLPGISVSYLLLVLGLYDKTMAAVTQFDLMFLAVLGTGVILGILLTTKLLDKAMARYPQPVYLIILGFVLGSMVQVFPGLPAGGDWIVCAAALAAGFFAIRFVQAGEEA